MLTNESLPQVEPPLYTVDEGIQPSDDIVSVDAEIECEVDSSASCDAFVIALSVSMQSPTETKTLTWRLLT